QQYTCNSDTAHIAPLPSPATCENLCAVGTATGTALGESESTTRSAESPQHHATPCTSIAHAAPTVTACDTIRISEAICSGRSREPPMLPRPNCPASLLPQHQSLLLMASPHLVVARSGVPAPSSPTITGTPSATM